MEPNAPSTGPDQSRLLAAGPARGRSLLGLPARLALLVLLAVVVFVTAIVAYADVRLSSANDEHARDSAVSAAREVGQQFGPADFTKGDKQFRATLAAVLERVALRDPDVKSVALYAVEGKDVRLQAAWPTGDARQLESRAIEALRADRESVGDVGSTVDAAWPLLVDTSEAQGIVVVTYDASTATAAANTTRRQLVLGSLVAGALLAATLLLLLRRELFRPLDEMRHAMVQIHAGAKGVRIGWNRGDELGAVALQFDEMVGQLEETQSELAKYVNTDPLTGLLTADAFTDRFAAELTRARREGYPISLVAIDIDALEEVNVTHDRAAGDQVLAAIGNVIGGCTRPTDACGRTGGDSFHVALVGAEASQAAVVIGRIRREIAERVGIGPERTRVTCGYGVAEFPQHAVDQIALERMAEAACSHAQRDGRDHALAFGPAGGYIDAMSLAPAEDRTESAGAKELSSTVHALARSLDGIDPALGGSAHSQRVARYAAAVARDLGFVDGQLRELRSAAVLHDIGKVAVPPELLRVPEDQLDDRQRGAFRYHAWVARTMIAGAGLPGVADIVFHMSERWDGTGYPERMREEAIPFASRVLRAAELLDDLTTGARGRQPMDPFRAAGELKRLAGHELDPDVAVRLARLVREEGLVGNEPARRVAEDDAADAEAA